MSPALRVRYVNPDRCNLRHTLSSVFHISYCGWHPQSAGCCESHSELPHFSHPLSKELKGFHHVPERLHQESNA